MGSRGSGKEGPPPRGASADLDGSYRQGVVPLPSSKTGRVPPPQRSPSRAAAAALRARASEVVSANAALPASPDGEPPAFLWSDDGSRVEGRRQNLDPNVLRRLRQGALPVERSLDLHGLSREKARIALDRFVADARASHARTVLVIHGKGAHSAAGAAVLREEVPRWLVDAPAAHHVLCFTSARPCDGGTGALYIRLASASASAPRPRAGRPRG